MVSANPANPYAAYLHACLERYARPVESVRYARLTDELTIGISQWQVRHGFGGKLSPEKLAAFDGIVRQGFLSSALLETALRVKHGAAIVPTLTEILARYDFTEDDIPLETMVRYFYRYRQRQPVF